MTKKLILIFIFVLQFLTIQKSFSCPTLEGRYYCVFQNQNYSPLLISQNNLSLELTDYFFLYSRLSNEADEFKASTTGYFGEDGWINYCDSKKITSITFDGRYKNEIYLNEKNEIIFRYNDIVNLNCPKY